LIVACFTGLEMLTKGTTGQRDKRTGDGFFVTSLAESGASPLEVEFMLHPKLRGLFPKSAPSPCPLFLRIFTANIAQFLVRLDKIRSKLMCI